MGAKTTKQDKQPSQFPSAFLLFRPSFDALWLNVIPLLVVIFLPIFLISILAAIVIGISATGSFTSIDEVSPFVWALFGLFTLGFMMLILPAGFYLQLVGAQNKKVTIGETYHKALHYLLRILGLTIVVGIIVLVGLILLIIPGLFMIKRYILSPYFLIDKELGIFKAMRQSHQASKKFSGPIWALMGVTFLVQAAGWLISYVPVLGQMASFALTTVYGYAPAVRYEQINDASKN